MLDCIVYKHNGIPPTTKVVGILPVRIVKIYDRLNNAEIVDKS